MKIKTQGNTHIYINVVFFNVNAVVKLKTSEYLYPYIGKFSQILPAIEYLAYQMKITPEMCCVY